jgi:clan AA aspartic protease (TIGR02281 family)
MSGRTLLAALALSLIAAGAQAETSAPARCTVQQIVDLPVTMQGLRPIVPAKINGHDVRLLVDTGAFYSMITKPAATELGLKVRRAEENFFLEGAGGGAERPSLAHADTFTLGTASRAGIDFLVSNRSYVSDAMGLLGANVLSVFDSEFDFQGGALRLFKSAGCANANLAYWSTGRDVAVMDVDAISASNYDITGWVTLNGRRIRALFDTGARQSIVNKSTAESLGFRPEAVETRGDGLTGGVGGGMMESWIYRFDLLDLGGEQIRNPKLRVADLKMTVGVILGSDFFLSHRVYFARNEHKLYFTYNGGPVFDLTAPESTRTALQQELAGGASGTDADQLERLAAAAMARHDYAAALSGLDKAIALAPSNARLFAARGTARWRRGEPALARADYDQALKLDPKDVETLLARGELELEQKTAEAAKRDFAAAEASAPDEDRVKLEVAELYANADMFPEALTIYDSMLASRAKHEDEDHKSEVHLARCYSRTMARVQLEDAEEDCETALRYGARTAEALERRGLIRLRLKRYGPAIYDFDEALAKQPKLAWALYGRGLAKIGRGEAAAGQTDLEAAEAIAPSCRNGPGAMASNRQAALSLAAPSARTAFQKRYSSVL